MNTEPQIEPVTDEDVGVAMDAPGMRAILEQDRRRVAERVAGRTAEMAEWVGIAAEIERLRAEVAALKAAEDSLLDRLERAKAAQANMIDATGAVETGVFWYSGRYVVEIPKSMALSRVLIVRVAK